MWKSTWTDECDKKLHLIKAANQNHCHSSISLKLIDTGPMHILGSDDFISCLRYFIYYYGRLVLVLKPPTSALSVYTLKSRKHIEI